jgi:hypothetical protein
MTNCKVRTSEEAVVLRRFQGYVFERKVASEDEILRQRGQAYPAPRYFGAS